MNGRTEEKTLADVIEAVVNLLKTVRDVADVNIEISGLGHCAYAVVEVVNHLEEARESDDIRAFDAWLKKKMKEWRKIPINSKEVRP